MTNVLNVTLNNGVEIPQLGFGVYKIPNDDVARAVRTAVECGYRSIDTAALYRNEEGVGEGIASSGVPRQELFVTTKLWNTDQGYERALAAFGESLDRLKLDYVDLYLIHWPVPANDAYVDTWKALEKLYADGWVRAVGVSNFQPSHLQRILTETETVPAVNQIELHPHLQQENLRSFHAQHGIATEAWSPLAKGGVLRDDAITELAARYGKTPAQIILRWHVQLGNIVIPKSVTPSRIAENIGVFDFELTAEDIATIADLDAGARIGPHPDTLS